ncbi:MAG TPA: nuclear transport factor 2 family protein [Terriglobales bacterium]|nr:nuclear transport factor 2 family protein [Terriglobales bacterium]
MKIGAPAFALALAGCAATPAGPDAAASLAAAETAFAAHSVREDMRAAFLAAFAPDGVFVRNGWMVSNDYLRDRPAPPIVLDWRPVFVEVAASGELGVSTGPSRITSKAKPETPPSYGQFVSVWRRSGDGPWKVEVDLGISHAAPALWNAPLETRTVRAAAQASRSLAEAEARFAERARAQGLRAAHHDLGASDLRLYRAGHAPAVGRAAVLASPALDDSRCEWTVERLETARSADFGYARGRYARVDRPGEPAGWYLRVWKREGADWRVLLDVVNEAPKKPQA